MNRETSVFDMMKFLYEAIWKHYLSQIRLNIRNMKKFLILTIAIIMATSTTVMAGDIKLPAPQRQGGMALSEALDKRQSQREFDGSRALSPQLLSNLLWSAAGINRPEEGKRTNPTALNTQEIDIYVFTPEGVYLYDFKDNSLRIKAEGDHRALVAGTKAFSQDFVLEAPVSLVLVANVGKFERKNDFNPMMAMADAGIVSQNINLFCAANGLATVPRASMDGDGIRALLNLDASFLPALNNPVGYAK